MILGLGSDLIEITHVKKAARKGRFLMRTFAEKEQRQSGGSIASPAGCFVAKEVIVKYFGAGLRGIGPVEVEVLRDALGKPYVRLSGAATTYCVAFDGLTPLVSISNTKAHTMAVAVLKQRGRGGTK